MFNGEIVMIAKKSLTKFKIKVMLLSIAIIAIPMLWVVYKSMDNL